MVAVSGAAAFLKGTRTAPAGRPLAPLRKRNTMKIHHVKQDFDSGAFTSREYEIVDKSERVAAYLEQAIHLFLLDPPTSEFQQGYLSALLLVYREALECGDTASWLEANALLGPRIG
jgi:hypothetical protein